jgi:hypothetical protein
MIDVRAGQCEAAISLLRLVAQPQPHLLAPIIKNSPISIDISSPVVTLPRECFTVYRQKLVDFRNLESGTSTK